MLKWKLKKKELYNLEEDRTETNDLSASHPGRVKAMAAEWFRLGKDVDRLKGRGLAPVSNKTKPLNFRRDTSSGTAKQDKKKK